MLLRLLVGVDNLLQCSTFSFRLSLLQFYAELLLLLMLLTI